MVYLSGGLGDGQIPGGSIFLRAFQPEGLCGDLRASSRSNRNFLGATKAVGGSRSFALKIILIFFILSIVFKTRLELYPRQLIFLQKNLLHPRIELDDA